MAAGLTRRDLFRLGATRPPQQRPPWAAAERRFVALCDRCGDCVPACPTRILVAGDGGFPIVEFGRGGCTFCGDCVAACRTGALRRDGPAWALTAAIGGGCLAVKGTACRTCGDWCEPGAIRFQLGRGGSATPVVAAERCTGCGDCVRPCPTGAVAMVRSEEGEIAACA